MIAKSRREFIFQTVLATIGFTILPGCKEKNDNTIIPNKEYIIVIGAGIAGLAAAKTLNNAGNTVVILEANEYYGGRIQTVSFNDYYADLGASWIHGIDGNPLYSLTIENNINTIATHYDPSYIFDINGEEVTNAEWSEIEALLEQLVSLAYENPNISLKSLLSLIEPDLNLSDKLLRTFYGSVRSEIEIPYAVDSEDISAKALTTNDSFPGEDVIFKNGMGQLTDILAQGLDIRYNTFVTKISYSDDKVSIYTKSSYDIDSQRPCLACHSGSDATILDYDKIFTADKVVVALPLGMLKNNNVIFDPVLPSEKLNAINSLGMGIMNKVFLKFEQNFWNTDGYFFQYLKQDYSKIFEFFSPTPTGSNNIIIAVFAGAQARSIENMNDEKVIDLVMNDLKGMFGTGIPNPIAMQKTSWHTNPYSLGSYPHLKPGADLSACSLIAEPINNKIYFAGDATSKDYMATAHGAYLSGIKAANSIINS